MGVDGWASERRKQRRPFDSPGDGGVTDQPAAVCGGAAALRFRDPFVPDRQDLLRLLGPSSSRRSSLCRRKMLAFFLLRFLSYHWSIGSCLPIHCDASLAFFPLTWVKTGSQLGDRAGSTGQLPLNREINVRLSTGCHRLVLSPSLWDIWGCVGYCVLLQWVGRASQILLTLHFLHSSCFGNVK